MTSRSKIYVLCAANSGYAMPLAVMLTSLVCNFKGDRDLDIHVIEADMPAELRAKIEVSVMRNKTGDYRLMFHWTKLDASLIRHLPVGGDANRHITTEAYSRLLAPDVLPPECERVVYLDCDTVVLKDVGALNDAADPERTISAVAAVNLPYVSTLTSVKGPPVVFNHVELGIAPTTRYFNSGVLVINLPLWRKQDITAKVFNYLERYKDEVLYHDQGGLNAILHDQWHRLDQRWNHTGALYPENWKAPAFSYEEWARVATDPYLAHYLGEDKPWKPNFKRPRGSFFRRYLRKTLFKDEVKMPPVTLVETVIGYRTFFWLWRVKRRLDSFFAKSGDGVSR